MVVQVEFWYACHINITQVLQANAVCGDSLLHLHARLDNVMLSSACCTPDAYGIPDALTTTRT